MMRSRHSYISQATDCVHVDELLLHEEATILLQHLRASSLPLRMPVVGMPMPGMPRWAACPTAVFRPAALALLFIPH